MKRRKQAGERLEGRKFKKSEIKDIFIYLDRKQPDRQKESRRRGEKNTHTSDSKALVIL